MFLAVGRAGAVLLMAMIMCFISGLIALRKVQKTDPAEVF
jgi:putative ABC transport system permease protein